MSSTSHSRTSRASSSSPSSSGGSAVGRSVTVAAGGSGGSASNAARLGNSARIILFLRPNTAFAARSAVRLSIRSAHGKRNSRTGLPR
nr:MAG: hypothetical protein [Equine parapoxvirus]